MKFIDKFKTRQFGLLLIIIGAFIPSMLYPFATITTSATLAQVAFARMGVSHDTSLQDFEIVLVKGEYKKDINSGRIYDEGKLAIPYKYTMAFGILLFFIGIGIVALYNNRRRIG